MMHEGVTQPTVAIIAPDIPATLVPTKVEALRAIGPGVIWEIVRRSANSSKVSQLCTFNT